MGDCINSNKRAIQDLFHEKWRERWKHLTTCHQTKYWIDNPGSLGDATARLDRLTLSTVLQALTGHNYLNYHHHIAGNFSVERDVRSSYTLHASAQHLPQNASTPYMASGLVEILQTSMVLCLVRFTKVNRTGKALERRAE